jgi:hypothetical protein
MLIGIAFAVVLGSVGGLFPRAWHRAKEILTALREGVMDAELKNLQIDRSKRRSAGLRSGPPAGSSRACCCCWRFRRVASFLAPRLNAAPRGGSAARHRRFRRQRARRRGAQRHRLHRGGAQDRTGRQSGRQSELDRRGQGRPREGRPGAGPPGRRRVPGLRAAGARAACQPAGQAGRSPARFAAGGRSRRRWPI